MSQVNQWQDQKDKVFAHLEQVHDWRSPYGLVQEVWGSKDMREVIEMRAVLNALSREGKIIGDFAHTGRPDTIRYAVVAEDIWTVVRTGAGSVADDLAWASVDEDDDLEPSDC